MDNYGAIDSTYIVCCEPGGRGNPNIEGKRLMAGVKKQDGEESGRSKLRAEAEKKVARSADKSEEMKKRDLDKLVHELLVHQVELEMQNEELRGAQEQIAKSRNAYADLYDFSPVGYLTFNGDALIIGLNLTGAALLGVERQKLLRRRFRQFVAPADAELWDRHFVSGFTAGGEAKLRPADQAQRWCHPPCQA